MSLITPAVPCESSPEYYAHLLCTKQDCFSQSHLKRRFNLRMSLHTFIVSQLYITLEVFIIGSNLISLTNVHRSGSYVLITTLSILKYDWVQSLCNYVRQNWLVRAYTDNFSL